MSTRISIPDEFADVLAKAAKLLKEGQSVTLIPADGGGCDIFYAQTNQLVIFAPPALSMKEAQLQKFGVGDRIARGRNNDCSAQYCVKRIESKDRIIVSPINNIGVVDWSSELLFKPVEIVLIQSFQDYLLHGLDISTVSESWASLEASKKLKESLQKQLIEVEAKILEISTRGR